MNRLFLQSAALGALCALAGCVDVDKATAPTAREYWTPPQNALPQSDLEIPLPNAATPVGKTLAQNEPMGLPTLVDIALENNPQTRQSWFAAKSAAANFGASQSGYYPSVTGTVSGTRQRYATPNYYAAGGGVVKTDISAFQPTVALHWLVYDFGKRESDVGRARQALFQANFEYNQAIQDTVLSVQVAYYAYNTALGMREAARANYDDAKANYDAAKAKLDNGLGTTQDTLQADAQMRSAEYAMAGAESAMEKARAQLASVLGLPVSDALSIVPTQDIPTSDFLEKQVGDLTAAALKTRPSLLAQYANLRQAQYAAASASANRWPRIVAFGQYDYNYPRIEGENYSYNTWMGGVALQWEVFTGFQKTYALIGAHQQEKAAREALRTAELDIVAQVWEYYYAFKSSLSQLTSSDAQVKAQTDAYHAIREGYENGLTSFLDLLTASNNLASARENRVNALGNLATAIARLAHATGNMALTQPDSAVEPFRKSAAASSQR